MRIVVLDGHTLNPGDNPWDDLAALGDLVVHDRTPAEAVVERASGAAVVLTNKTPLPADVLAALPALRFVGVLATGYDVVDVAAARARRILVANVPEYATDAVAQHVLALLLELCHRVGEHDAAVRAGEWTRAGDFSFWHVPPRELAGQTMGIVGFGRIGRRVGELAHALGMAVIAATRDGGGAIPPPYTPFAWRSRARLFAEADVVSLHCPLTPETAGFVDAALLRTMRPSAILVNTARGGLVNEADVAAALRAGTIAGFAADVVSREPITADNPLLAAPHSLLTPHLAWASLAARRRLMATAVANVRAFLAGRPVNLVGA